MINIKVSPLFLRIVCKDYGYCFDEHNAFHPTKQHLFTSILLSVKERGGTSRHHDLLTHTLTTSLKVRNINEYGITLHKWAIDTFCRAVDAISMQSVEPIADIVDYLLNYYSIADEEYMRETAYRTYYKYKKNKETKNVTALMTRAIQPLAITDTVDQLSIKAAAYIRNSPGDLLCDYHTYRATMNYALYMRGFKQREIASNLITSTKNIHISIRRFGSRMQREKELTTIIAILTS